MVKTNSNMKVLLNEKDNKQSLIKFDSEKMEMLFYPRIIEIYGCVVIESKNIINKSLNLDVIEKVYYNKTGFEASLNEFRINDFIEEGDKYSILKLSIVIMKVFKNRLKLEYPKYEFIIGFSILNENSTFRFYKKRKNESWYSDDLDKYEEEAIMLEEI